VRVAPNVGGRVREVQVRPSVYRDFGCISVGPERVEIKMQVKIWENAMRNINKIERRQKQEASATR
jgi:hypothetical protein